MCDSRPPDKKEETALRDGARPTAGLAGTRKSQKTKKTGVGLALTTHPIPGIHWAGGGN